MPTSLECRLAIGSNGLPNANNISGYATSISAHLLNGSHGDIVLNCAGPLMVSHPLAPGQQSYAIDLHNELLWINQNPPNHSIQRICVIYAHNYLGLSNVFGIMFDRGFTTRDDPNGSPVYVDRPRQGCAVFLGSIAANRSASESGQEGLFTSIHEIGHIFNLQHDETVPNFLHSSASGQTFPQNYYQFTPAEQDQLSVCSNNNSVMPGGSSFGAGSATNLPSRWRGQDKAVAIEIELSISRNEFWQFEPVQLDIEVRPSVRKRIADIPQLIDPGAEGFDIMIENESGERRLYRAPVVSCGLPGSILVTREAPYRRDLPIFGQAGGYTFRHTGCHRIWAEFAWAAGKARSNVLEVDVRREIGLSPNEEKYRTAVKDESVGSMLFNRRDLVTGHGIVRLNRFLTQDDTTDGRGELFYALARAIEGAGSVKKSGKRERKILERLLDRSLRDGTLSGYQKEKREALFESLV